LNQSYINKEIIVIDDGSTDASVDVIKTFGNRIRWETGSNRGASSARNRGLSICHGEIIQFLDADDFLLPNKLATQVPALQDSPNAVVFSDWLMELNDQKVIDIHLPWEQTEDPFYLLLNLKPALMTAAPLHWRRNIERIGGWDAQLPCCQDLDFHLRLACENLRFLYVRGFSFHCRHVSTSISRSNYKRILQWQGYVLFKIYHMLLSSGTLTLERKELIAYTMAKSGRQLMAMREYRSGRQRFVDAELMCSGGGIKRFGWKYWFLYNLLGPFLTERLSQILYSRLK